MVRIEELHRQRTEQDHHACHIQRAAELPPAHHRIHGIRTPASHRFRTARPRRSNAVCYW